VIQNLFSKINSKRNQEQSESTEYQKRYLDFYNKKVKNTHVWFLWLVVIPILNFFMISYYKVNNQILFFTIPTPFIEIFRYVLISAVIIITVFAFLRWLYLVNKRLFPWTCLLLTLILCPVISSWFLSGESIYQILLCCDFLALIISVGLWFLVYWLSERGYKKFAKKYVNYLVIREEGEHTAIILPHDETRMIEGADDPSEILIEGLQKYNEKFQVYFCLNTDDFLHVLQNPNVKRLWIFGHGTRGGVCLNSFLTYAEFMTEKIGSEWETRNIQSMEYVYQCHCNGGDNRPLTDYLLKEKGLLNEKIDGMPNYLDTGVVNIKPPSTCKFLGYKLFYSIYKCLVILHITDGNLNNILSIKIIINRYLAHLEKRVNDQT